MKVWLWDGKSELSGEHHTVSELGLSNCKKKPQKIYYCDFFVLGHIGEATNMPEDISSQVLKENEVKMIKLKCNW